MSGGGGGVSWERADTCSGTEDESVCLVSAQNVAVRLTAEGASGVVGVVEGERPEKERESLRSVICK